MRTLKSTVILCLSILILGVSYVVYTSIHDRYVFIHSPTDKGLFIFDKKNKELNFCGTDGTCKVVKMAHAEVKVADSGTIIPTSILQFFQKKTFNAMYTSPASTVPAQHTPATSSETNATKSGATNTAKTKSTTTGTNSVNTTSSSNAPTVNAAQTSATSSTTASTNTASSSSTSAAPTASSENVSTQSSSPTVGIDAQTSTPPAPAVP